MSEPGLSYLVAGHQPNFFPWFGYFEKMLKCDLFVHSDDVQFPKQSYTNRVEIPIGGRSAFMTLPVRKGDNARIADKRYLKDPAVMSKLVKTLRIILSGLPNFSDVEPVIAEFESAWALRRTVADFNIYMNQYLASSFGICTPCRRGTELGLDEFYRNERLIERCRRLASHDYLCGQGADGYQDDTMLEEAGIRVHRINYDVGRVLFGDALRYSALYGLGLVGLARIRAAVAEYKLNCGGR